MRGFWRQSLGHGRHGDRADRLGTGGRPQTLAKAGCDGHLVKPVELPALQILLGELASTKK
jgi:hypothetical protein